MSSPRVGDTRDRFQHDRAWLERLPRITAEPTAFEQLERRLLAWLEEFRTTMSGLALQDDDKYLDRAWNCWAWHWRTALTADADNVDGHQVAEQIREGRGFTGNRNLGGDPIFDVLLATAFVDRHEAAIHAFIRAYQEFCLGVAGKYDSRFKDDPDWWPEFLEELGGFTSSPGGKKPKLNGFRGHCALRNWLGTVVRRHLHDRRSGSAREDEAQHPVGEVADPDDALAGVMSADCKERLQKIIARLLDDLRPRDRLLFDFLLVERLTQREAAALLKIHPGNVTRSLERIVKQLRTGWETLPSREKRAADDCYPELTALDWLDILADLSRRQREGRSDV